MWRKWLKCISKCVYDLLIIYFGRNNVQDCLYHSKEIIISSLFVPLNWSEHSSSSRENHAHHNDDEDEEHDEKCDAEEFAEQGSWELFTGEFST